MSTSAIDIVQVETEKVDSGFGQILHHYEPEQVFRCARGLPYKSSCGITFDPTTQSLGAPIPEEYLNAMEKCAMCQTVLSHKNHGL